MRTFLTSEDSRDGTNNMISVRHGGPTPSGDRPQTGPWGGPVPNLQPRPRSGLENLQTGGLEPLVPRDAR
jgi:hypothetical protein